MNKELDAIMRPSSVALIGASTRAGSLNKEIVDRLLDYEYVGKLYPVNPKADYIDSIKCYKSVMDIPDTVDLAIIMVPKEVILNVIDDCGKKGVKGLIIITSGFKETGSEGAKLEEELKARIKKYNMRSIGPNCVGVINTNPETHMNATFAGSRPIHGKTAFVSQSGGLGVSIMNISNNLNIGISQFVSVGNKLDVCESSLIEYWGDDDTVDKILLYLESVENAEEFRRVTSKVTKKKPVVAIKAGVSPAGMKAASSHTGALAGTDKAVDALLKQSGVIRVESLSELFDTAQVFTASPIPKGDRVGVVSNAGGFGVLAIDELHKANQQIAEFSEKTVSTLRSFLLPQASPRNPVDVVAGITYDDYQRALETVLVDDNVDSVVVIYVALNGPDLIEIVKKITETRIKMPEKPIVGVFMAEDKYYDQLKELDVNIPYYRYPEYGVNALAKLDAQRKWMERPVGKEPSFNISSTELSKIKSIFENVVKEKRQELTTLESIDILRAYGIKTCKYAFAVNMDEALKKAEEVGYPVVMKISSKKISHKTEIGGVVVGIKNAQELEKAYTKLLNKLKELKLENDLEGVIIQEMVDGSREITCGISVDPMYGHLIMFGLGGIYIESFKDIIFRVNPITDVDAEEMIKSIKTFNILKGARNKIPANIECIKDTLLRLSQLVKNFSFIEELDINPLKVSDETGDSIAVDCRIKIKEGVTVDDFSPRHAELDSASQDLATLNRVQSRV